MDLYDVPRDFFTENSEMKHLQTDDGKAFVSCLADICEKRLK